MSKAKMYETAIPGGQTRRIRERDLSPKLRKLIKRQKRDGVSLSVDWKSRKYPYHVTAIHWRPGRRNALAAMIIKHCHDPLKLDLDGHRYTITPQEPQ